MAKQTFSVGQVLTAAQMTSLQQTAMLGGSATAKTTSYTLVAADAGTVVSVNSTSATTITVNTGLFAAGDTVTIQNWGSGAITITAGTATVNTAGSLIVPQYDGGVLYFTSASAAIYFDWVQAGAVSPLTTKGDIWGYGTSDARIPIGANDTVLTADSTQSLGLKWAAPSSGSLTQLASGTLSGTSVSITSISQSYKDLRLVITNAVRSGAGGTNISIQTNTNTTSNYIYSSTRNIPGGTMAMLGNKGNIILAGPEFSGSASYHTTIVEFIDYTNSTTIVPIRYQGFSTANSVNTSFGVGCWYDTPAAVTSIQIGAQGDTFASGDYVLFGVK